MVLKTCEVTSIPHKPQLLHTIRRTPTSKPATQQLGT